MSIASKERMITLAPGGPGIAPRWTSSAKTGVGTAMSPESKIWFTLSHGIVNEVYYPRDDIANIRDMGFIVTDGKTFFSEEKKNTTHETIMLKEGVPAYQITNTCSEGRYKIVKRIITDPRRNVLLQEIEFVPLKGKMSDYHLYVILAPHLSNAGMGNNGWCGQFKGVPMFFAERSDIVLACSCSTPFSNMSCGYVGTSDSWQDLHQNKKMTQFYQKATDGNICFTGEIDLAACNGRCVIALGFALHMEETGMQTRASLLRSFDSLLNDYIQSWDKVQKRFIDLVKGKKKESPNLYRTSLAVLKTHEGKHFSGSVIASLSIPWGDARGDDDISQYHFIWPRDQVQIAEAFIACGDYESARETLLFLMCTQESEGHWPQCISEEGTAFWKTTQLDECALPILLADCLKKENGLDNIDPWPMIAKAAAFLVKKGPMTEKDRWEENGGYTPFTIATEIAALLVAADYFVEHGQEDVAAYLYNTADWWNHSIEEWLYVKDTTLARDYQVEGYYVRVTPEGIAEDPSKAWITIPNRPEGMNIYHYTEIISVDALALVLFGLRDANDPRILNTVKIIDALLKSDTVNGTVWHRYNEDGYGERVDGSPFEGIGLGRGWPMLTCERGLYELAKGNKTEANRLLKNVVSLAGEGQLLPEQTWDSADIPEKKLFNGQPTGAALPHMPTEAGYLRFLRSVSDNAVFAMPHQTVRRYLEEKVTYSYAIWRFGHECKTIEPGKILRIQSHSAAKIRWSIDAWKTFHNVETRDSGLGVLYADIPTDNLPEGCIVEFTFYWPSAGVWEGTNFKVEIKAK
jgi:glucoamylase